MTFGGKIEPRNFHHPAPQSDMSLSGLEKQKVEAAPEHEQNMDEPVLARSLIQTARLWATLHPTECQEVRDHIALRVLEELGADIG